MTQWFYFYTHMFQLDKAMSRCFQLVCLKLLKMCDCKPEANFICLDATDLQFQFSTFSSSDLMGGSLLRGSRLLDTFKAENEMLWSLKCRFLLKLQCQLVSKPVKTNQPDWKMEQELVLLSFICCRSMLTKMSYANSNR